MKVPLLDLKPQNGALMPELREAFERVFATSQFILGAEVRNFEEQCAKYAGVGHAIGVSSGTDAILLALMALGIKAGDEVICPSFTFFATAGCVARLGARPVFADSCPYCFNLDVADVRTRISPRTRAIIPVHLFGQMAPMDSLMELAHEHGLHVIEDAAQAFGASYRGRSAGSIGNCGTVSFFPSKNLGGFGDSGLLVTNDDALAAKALLLRTHGAEEKYFHKIVGANFRLDALQAALLSVKLNHLEAYTTRRMENAAYYHSQLAAIPGIAEGSRRECCTGDYRAPAPDTRILLPLQRSENRHIWNQYTLRITGGKRDAFRKYLQALDIATEIYYPQPMHRQECFQIPGYTQPSLPQCEQLAAECVSIPIYPDLTRPQLDYVIGAIAGWKDGTP